MYVYGEVTYTLNGVAALDGAGRARAAGRGRRRCGDGDGLGDGRRRRAAALDLHGGGDRKDCEGGECDDCGQTGEHGCKGCAGRDESEESWCGASCVGLLLKNRAAVPMAFIPSRAADSLCLICPFTLALADGT